MNIKDSVNQFYFDMTIKELSLMHDNTLYPDISYNGLLYLDIISYKENCTVSFLADAMHISKSAVTLKINELMKQGLIKKTQSPTDKRVNYLTFNEDVDKGYKICKNYLLDAVKIIEQKYSKKEIDTFCEMLAIISKSYK